MGGLDGFDDVLRVAGGGDGQQDIARMAERAYLLGKHHVVGVVVGDGGDDRGIGGECDGGQFLALALEAAHQLSGEMLRITSGAAVTAGQNLAAGN